MTPARPSGLQRLPGSADGQVAVDPGGGGTHLRPVHIHHTIRALAGIEDHPLTRRYPVLRPGDEPLPIFPEG